jgi:hypothetical protein
VIENKQQYKITLKAIENLSEALKKVDVDGEPRWVVKAHVDALCSEIIDLQVQVAKYVADNTKIEQSDKSLTDATKRLAALVIKESSPEFHDVSRENVLFMADGLEKLDAEAPQFVSKYLLKLEKYITLSVNQVMTALEIAQILNEELIRLRIGKGFPQHEE